jgi:alkaline phosphatase D
MDRGDGRTGWIPRRRALLKGGLASLLLAGASRTLAFATGYPRALAGPMIGAPGPTHFTVWVRASGAFPVVLEYSTSRDFSRAQRSAPVIAERANELCVTFRPEGLRPDTEYFYRLRYDGELDRFQPLPFHTRTAPERRRSFGVAFGSCARIQYDADQRIFDVVRQLEPDMFLWLGDNIYGDSDDSGALSELYTRQRVVERLAPLLRTTPQLAIWDDHDFGYNDSDSRSSFKAEALRLFKSYWANPSGGSDGTPGIWFRQSFGGVDFFMLDGRYHRDPSAAPDVPGKTMLGAAQKAWLKRELRASRAPFKVLVSGGGWSSAERGEGGDSWAVYRNERNEIFDFIRDQRIEGVVCISGDSHMGEINCIPRSADGGYDIYDFCSSPLAQMPATRQLRQVPEMRIRDVWSRTVNVGLMQFDMEGEPRLTYTLHDILGQPVWQPLVLRPQDLRNGVRSWDHLADPEELRRLERHRQGRGYYGIDPS